MTSEQPVGQPASTAPDSGPSGPVAFSLVDTQWPDRFSEVVIARGRSGFTAAIEGSTESTTIDLGDGDFLDAVMVIGGIELATRAKGSWTDANTFEAEILLVQTPHRIFLHGDRTTGKADISWHLQPPAGFEPTAAISSTG